MLRHKLTELVAEEPHMMDGRDAVAQVQDWLRERKG
jgi:hypothetical protein